MVKFPLWQKLILALGLAILLGGLFFYIHLGSYNRHWADDWCYNADLRNKGFLETLNGYFYDTTYTPSRYSVTIFTGLLQTFDVAGAQALTPLTLLAWVAGLLWMFWNVARLAGLAAPQPHERPVTALLTFFSVLSVYFSVHLTPHLYQSLYWRTGLLTYTTPLVLMTWVFVLITRQALQPRPSRMEAALAGILALLAGGCSEAGTTVLVSALGFYVGAALLYRKHPWAQKTLASASVSLLCALLAMGLLVFSPTTQIRGQRYGDPTPLADLPRLVFNYTYAYFVLAVRDYTQPLIALLAAFAGFAFPLSDERSFKQYLVVGGMTAIVTILLVAASLTPSIYVEKGLPAPRTMIIPSFIAVSGFAVGGWAAGSGLRAIFKFQRLQTVAAVAFLFTLAFPVTTLIRAFAWESIYATRAQLWDVRAVAIQSALSVGENRVTIQAIDGLPVDGIRDFDPPEKKGYWITMCAEEYYGIKLDVILP
jgi:hypothetical protein